MSLDARQTVFDVFVRNWSENPIGEQTDGPEILKATYPTRAEADACADRIRVYREETMSGGAYGNWVWVRERTEKDNRQ